MEHGWLAEQQSETHLTVMNTHKGQDWAVYNLSVDTCLALKCTNTQIKESQKSRAINL